VIITDILTDILQTDILADTLTDILTDILTFLHIYFRLKQPAIQGSDNQDLRFEKPTGSRDTTHKHVYVILSWTEVAIK
jgi:hypothetical protein